VAGSQKAKPGLRDRLRERRAARKQRAAERARLGTQNQVPRNAQHHAYDKGAPFGPSGG
jgi:hypothetical protein